MTAHETRVEQVMNPDVLTVAPGTTTMAALRQMAEKHVGSIVAIKNKKPAGIFTERDLLYKVVLAGKNPEQTQVREVMTRNVVSIAPNESVESAMNKMTQGNFRHLLVADDGDDIHGIISIKDLARALRQQLIAGRRPDREMAARDTHNRVEHVMDPDVLTVKPSTTTMDALRQMAEKHVGSIVATKNKTPVGIFTERDLLYKVVLGGKNPERTSVREVMTRNVVSIAPDSSVESAMNKMAHGNFRHLLVVDDEDDIHGMISIRDVARALQMQLLAGPRPAA